MKRFVLGDIHGGYKALIQVFERSGFNYDKDELIVLGDICDGWAYVKQCIDEVLKVKNLIYVIGNHDVWTLEWMKYNLQPELWLSQGGRNTIKSYESIEGMKIPASHIDLFENKAYLYYEDDNCLFLHAGLKLEQKNIKKQEAEELYWNRTMIQTAWKRQLRADQSKLPAPNLTGYREVFIGHTTTLMYKTMEPMHCCEIWNLDTGGGWGGKLTIMDRDSHEYWQSDIVAELYPGERGRS